MKRVREELGWTPVWEGDIQNYAKSYISKNAWKVDEVNSFDDLLQDAYLVFHKVKTAYPRVVEAPHFMALFKTALANSMIDKARYRQRKLEIMATQDADISEAMNGQLPLAEVVGEYSNDGHIRIVLEELPEEIKLILSVFSDEEKLKLLRQKTRRSPVRETLVMKLCRVAGVPWRKEIATELREALS